MLSWTEARDSRKPFVDAVEQYIAELNGNVDAIRTSIFCQSREPTVVDMARKIDGLYVCSPPAGQEDSRTDPNVPQMPSCWPKDWDCYS